MNGRAKDKDDDRDKDEIWSSKKNKDVDGYNERAKGSDREMEIERDLERVRETDKVSVAKMSVGHKSWRTSYSGEGKRERSKKQRE